MQGSNIRTAELASCDAELSEVTSMLTSSGASPPAARAGPLLELGAEAPAACLEVSASASAELATHVCAASLSTIS